MMLLFTSSISQFIFPSVSSCTSFSKKQEARILCYNELLENHAKNDIYCKKVTDHKSTVSKKF
jgi:hypothetical protein